MMPSFEEVVRAEFKDMRQDIRELRQDINRYKGFVGGLIWAGGACVAAFQLVYNHLKGVGL